MQKLRSLRSHGSENELVQGRHEIIVFGGGRKVGDFRLQTAKFSMIFSVLGLCRCAAAQFQHSAIVNVRKSDRRQVGTDREAVGKARKGFECECDC